MLTRRLTILEGPDGGGKSSLAARFRELSPFAHHVHCGPFPHVTKGLARLYVEAMLPALLGLADVVMDRAWFSEPIYGSAFRGGEDRLGAAQRRMLTRLALRCDVRLVLCLPGVESCLETFRGRKGEELLEREEQLKQVYEAYDQLAREPPGLPTFVHNYHLADEAPMLVSAAGEVKPHKTHWRSAGNRAAPVVLVGEALGEVKEYDSLFRAPFVSFDRGGCSAWLTDLLGEAGYQELSFLWANADDPALGEIISAEPRQRVVALGRSAHEALDWLIPGGLVRYVDHPQHAKRFHHHEPYELLDVLQEVLP